ncbi:hypothetical protein [Pseudarthrobacter sp. YAF2]|uniref:hypothetical protein n=1 Tax=Pseudarthrobacter sp. YAF2 TaxID=3233078 RepID=UPI003F9A0A1F
METGLDQRYREFPDAMAARTDPLPPARSAPSSKPSPNVISKYRNRLIAAGLIQSAGHGKVGFVISGLRQYLRE